MTDISNLKTHFQNITLWKRGGERAPHKPLLALYAIGRLRRNNDRLIPYAEIDQKLSELLKDFGPYRKTYNPHYPFWRFQKDGIWEVDKTEDIVLTSSGDPKKPDLIRLDVHGGFPKEVFDALRSDDKLVNEIVAQILEDNFPSSIHEDILQATGIDLVSTGTGLKKRDPEFRDRILRAYEYRCAVCGFDVRLDHFPIALEAAHIKWHTAGGPDAEINGLALCTLHHKLFDRGAFTLADDLKIMISDRAHGTRGFDEWLMKFHGQAVKSPQRKTYMPDNGFLKWHIREVFRGEYRESQEATSATP